MKFVLQLSLSWFCLLCVHHAGGEPFLGPSDPFVRHELRWLSDSRRLNVPLNTWPISLGGVDAKLSSEGEDSPTESFLRRLHEERETGWARPNGIVTIRSERGLTRTFLDDPRGGHSAGVEQKWMGDRFAGKLRVTTLGDASPDWRGRTDEGFQFDQSYFGGRMGNWSMSYGQVSRNWGPGWDGSLILSTNARPVPAFSIDRRIPESFETKWLSWIGTWNASIFLGQMEEERPVPEPYLWGMRVEFAPTIFPGLEIGLSRAIQLGGQGRPRHLDVFFEAFISHDNVGANTGEDPANEPGNQLAGIDFRWRLPNDFPVAFYGQAVGEDEDHFLPNALMFQYGVETWGTRENSTWRLFAECADTASWWWNEETRTRNISYGHHLYGEGYRHYGRSLGLWADSDSLIYSLGGLLVGSSGNGWGVTFRLGELNRDGNGQSAVSDAVATDLTDIEIFRKQRIERFNFELMASVGWEKLHQISSDNQDQGLTGFLSFRRFF